MSADEQIPQDKAETTPKPKRKQIRRDRKRLNEDEVNEVMRLAGQGLSVTQIGHCLQMSKPTLERRLRATPGAQDAIQKGRSVAIERVTNKAYEIASSGKHPIFSMFWLKCRARWREKDRVADVQINNAQQTNLQIDPATLQSIMSSVDQLITERAQWNAMKQIEAPKVVTETQTTVDAQPVASSKDQT